jgi:inward rectifier potassium channel
MTEASFAASVPEFVVMITADDETFAQTVHARTSYDADDIVWGARFADMYVADEAHVAIDWNRLHEFTKVDPPDIL